MHYSLKLELKDGKNWHKYHEDAGFNIPDPQLAKNEVRLRVLLLLVSEIGTRISKSLDSTLLTIRRPRTRHVCHEPLYVLSEVRKKQDWNDDGRHNPDFQLPEKEVYLLCESCALLFLSPFHLVLPSCFSLFSLSLTCTHAHARTCHPCCSFLFLLLRASHICTYTHATHTFSNTHSHQHTHAHTLCINSIPCLSCSIVAFS